MQEIHLHGNGIGNEGARTLMTGLMSHKGMYLSLQLVNLKLCLIYFYFKYKTLSEVDCLFGDKNQSLNSC